MANIKKNAQGYGYKYTDLAEINNALEAMGVSYYQFTETENGVDYIFTVPIIDGEERPPRRGCRIVDAKLSGKLNPAQEQGSAITYARRYSLLMAFGFATTDDDAACLTVANTEKVNREMMDTVAELALAANVNPAAILRTYHIDRLEDMTAEQYADCVERLKRHGK